MSSPLADRIEEIAAWLGPRFYPTKVNELRDIASAVRKLEAREEARLSERAYSASPTGYGAPWNRLDEVGR